MNVDAVAGWWLTSVGGCRERELQLKQRVDVSKKRLSDDKCKERRGVMKEKGDWGAACNLRRGRLRGRRVCVPSGTGGETRDEGLSENASRALLDELWMMSA